MFRVVPSQVVRFIRDYLPRALPEIERFEHGEAPETTNFNAGEATAVKALLEHVRAIPTELLVLQEEDASALTYAVARMESSLDAWDRQTPVRPHAMRGNEQEPYKGLSPVAVTSILLSKCPDRFPSPHTRSLAFLAQPDLEDVLRLDMAEVEHCLAGAHWKGATVVGGSVVEALLLWALNRAGVAKAVAEASAQGLSVPGALEDWRLHQLVKVARGLAGVTQDTATAADLTRNFRNLIHPGVTQRKQEKCDRGTAYAAAAAIERVVGDLEAAVRDGRL